MSWAKRIDWNTGDYEGQILAQGDRWYPFGQLPADPDAGVYTVRVEPEPTLPHENRAARRAKKGRGQ